MPRCTYMYTVLSWSEHNYKLVSTEHFYYICTFCLNDRFQESNDDYNVIMVKALADRLAEVHTLTLLF